jgi:hypothetical protein
MTDWESLLAFRMKEAEETLTDAERMLQDGLSPRSITNRAYNVIAALVQENPSWTSHKT